MTRARPLRLANGAILAALAAYFLLAPGGTVARSLRDPAWREGGIPRLAWTLHRRLAPRYERWARARIASGAAARVHYLNVPATEWPLFGSVFFLWTTERLQQAWERDPARAPVAPAVHARGAIDACRDVLLDPAHHAWVRTHWGDDYLHDQNVFFRSLLVAGLASYERLTGRGDTLALLRDQADTLAAELDASPFGVLYDYPGECYPIDVFAAVAWIREADALTGGDHAAFVERQRRAFTGPRLDARGLTPWVVDPGTGEQHEPSRGIVNAHVLIFAPALYPDLARDWYARFERHFWQDRGWAAGWREFYRDRPRGEWTYDVDSGPVLAGFSPAANAFGIAAARANGRLDHAFTLSAQVLAASWPLPNGRLLGGRLLSDAANAPYLGEAGLLWQWTAPVPAGAAPVRGGRLAGTVWIGLAFYFGGAGLVLAAVARDLRRAWRERAAAVPAVQVAGWAALLAAAAALALAGRAAPALAALLAAQFLPRRPRPAAA